MTKAQYYGLPEGTNATTKFFSIYDTVYADYPCVGTELRYAFYQQSRTSIKHLDISQCTDLNNTFEKSGLLSTKGMKDWDFSNITSLNSLFMGGNLLKADETSYWNTSKVRDITFLFYGNPDIISIGSIKADSVESATMVFNYGNMDKLTDFGGFINLKCSITNAAFDKTPNLSYESCINILNGLYDFTGHAETPSSSQGKLKVHQNFLNKVGDEISIGTNKGWTITA